jgi:hypothetical protein
LPLAGQSLLARHGSPESLPTGRGRSFQCSRRLLQTKLAAQCDRGAAVRTGDGCPDPGDSDFRRIPGAKFPLRRSLLHALDRGLLLLNRGVGLGAGRTGLLIQAGRRFRPAGLLSRGAVLPAGSRSASSVYCIVARCCWSATVSEATCTGLSHPVRAPRQIGMCSA